MPSRIKCQKCRQSIRVVGSNRYFFAYLGVLAIISALLTASYFSRLASGWILIALGIGFFQLVEFTVSLIIVRSGRFERPLS